MRKIPNSPEGSFLVGWNFNRVAIRDVILNALVIFLSVIQILSEPMFKMLQLPKRGASVFR